MNVIKRIEIINFRSIERLVMENGLNDLNIIVGQNDSGKSNVLRALNLFFNYQTDLGIPLVFWEDFNKNIQRADRRSQYIKIVLDFDLKYEPGRRLRWSKRWDINGSLVEDDWIDITTNSKFEFAGRSRAPGWLERLRFRYVPAIKGPDFFKHLYEQLHDVLASVYNQQFSEDSQNFIQGIQNVTDAITDDLEREIGIRNRLSIPSDFKSLFATLDFSFENEQGKSYYLTKRGDGIKARHIPVIMRYLANNEHGSTQGSTSLNTIWGFEEPENNLEMSQAFEMAESFLAHAHPIQVFLTTHSPAFYSLNDGERVQKWFVRRNDAGNSVAVHITERNEVDLDHEMGMIAYITPIMEAKNRELENEKAEKDRLTEELRNATDRTRCLVFTEDKQNDAQLMRNMLAAHDFNMEETTVRSYHNKGMLKAAILAADLQQEHMPHLERVIFHRDRDIDGDDTNWVNEELRKQHRSKYRYFLTADYDLEAYYINAAHIRHLYPQLDVELIQQRIEQATEAKRTESLERLKNIYTQQKTKEHQDEGEPISKINFVRLQAEAQQLYDGNVARYRYGKKVLSHLLGLLQQDLGENLNVERVSPHLQIPVLFETKNLLWP